MHNALIVAGYECKQFLGFPCFLCIFSHFKIGSVFLFAVFFGGVGGGGLQLVNFKWVY